MAKESLKDRIYRYLSNNKCWVSSGDLQRLVMQHTTILPRTTVRRLQEMVTEGRLEVEYRKKHHAFYRALPERNYTKEFEDYWNQIPESIS